MPMEDEPMRVAVYFATTAERRLTEEALSRVLPEKLALFAGVAEGWATAATIDELMCAGMSVDLVDERFPAQIGPRAAAINYDVVDDLKRQARYANIEGGIVVSAAHAEATDPRIHHDEHYDARPAPADALDSDVYFVRIEGPITRRQRRELEALKVSIGAFLPPDRYRTMLTRAQYAKVRKLHFVRQVERYRVEDTVTRELATLCEKLRNADPAQPPPVQAFDCLVHRERDLAKVRALIEATAGMVVVGTSNMRVRFEGPASLPLLAALAALPEVRKLAPYEAPVLVSA